MKIKSIMLSLLVFMFLLPMNVFAAGKININDPVSLTIHYENEGVILEDVDFNLYQVATVDEYGYYTTTETFKDFNVNITDGDVDKWNTLASTILGYVLRDQVEPTTMTKTNNEGNAVFTSQKPGLYLVYGLNHVQDGYVYTSKPFFVQLPGIENNDWVYQIVATPKMDKITKEPIDIHVIKQWIDKGNEKLRPKEIIVDLLCNDEVYETVRLNQENNWRYTWEKLDSEKSWHVVEREVKGYSIKIEREGNTFVVNNTYDVPPPPPPPLDKTGLLWWPVPILFVGGAIFILSGLVINKQKEEDHEI